MSPTRRRAAAALVTAWTLWAQTRVSPPGLPIKDAWDVVDTFTTQEACEAAWVAIEPPPREAVTRPFQGTRYVCFPDTVDPRATP